MTTATITLLPVVENAKGDTYKIDLKTREVQGPAMHDPHALIGFQDDAEVQRVMLFADDLWAENPQMAVGMFPVFSAKQGGLFCITLAVESVTIEEN
jgi:hypothetical protein